MRFGIDDTKYIATIQEALLELNMFKKILPDTHEQLSKDVKEVRKILGVPNE